MKTAGEEYCTLGYLVTRLQVSFAKLERAVREQNIPPAYIENGCPHYDGAAVEKIRQAVRQQEGAAAGTPGVPGEGDRL